MPTENYGQQNIQSTGERLVRVETLIQNMSTNITERFDRIERMYSIRFAEIQAEQDSIQESLKALREQEGENLKGLKNKAVEYVMIAGLSGIITLLATALFKGGI